MRIVLPALVGLVILLGSAGVAEAREKAFSIDEEITYLADVPDELAEIKEDGYDKVGFYYKRFAVMGADVWTWSGTLVFFRTPQTKFEGFRTVQTTYYIEVDEETADRYGWNAPIRYYIPVGLLVVLCVVELVLVAMKKRKAKLVLGLGITLIVIAGVLYLLGLTWEVAFPLLLGVFHIVSVVYHPATNSEILAADRERDAEDQIPRAPPPRYSQEPMRPPPPNVETDPFRAPPQPPPLAVKRPPTAVASAPVVHDDNAEAPKLLR